MVYFKPIKIETLPNMKNNNNIRKKISQKWVYDEIKNLEVREIGWNDKFKKRYKKKNINTLF